MGNSKLRRYSVLTHMDGMTLARCFVCLFFAIVMGQSGVDKAMDWKGNLEYLTGHFSKTPFRNTVKPLLGTITLLEIVTALVCIGSIVLLLTKGQFVVFGLGLPAVAMSLACLDLCMLLFGQRIAKDYAGAVSLASYFAVALIGLVATASA